jgi:hypothetical protein
MREMVSDPPCNNWRRGDCRGSDDHEQEQENKDDFTAEELPYRRVREEAHFAFANDGFLVVQRGESFVLGSFQTSLSRRGKEKPCSALEWGS